MNMCEKPTLADKDKAAAQASGWQLIDLEWECLQEAAAQAWVAQDQTRAAKHWQAALVLARQFEQQDARLGCSLANVARVTADANERQALNEQAQAIWNLSPLWIDELHVVPRARSSLHHLRLERKNKHAYQHAAKRRLQDAAAAARLRLQQKQTIPIVQWYQQKPPTFDKARQLLAACYLLLPSNE